MMQPHRILATEFHINYNMLFLIHDMHMFKTKALCYNRMQVYPAGKCWVSLVSCASWWVGFCVWGGSSLSFVFVRDFYPPWGCALAWMVLKHLFFDFFSWYLVFPCVCYLSFFLNRKSSFAAVGPNITSATTCKFNCWSLQDCGRGIYVHV